MIFSVRATKTKLSLYLPEIHLTVTEHRPIFQTIRTDLSRCRPCKQIPEKTEDGSPAGPRLEAERGPSFPHHHHRQDPPSRPRLPGLCRGPAGPGLPPPPGQRLSLPGAEGRTAPAGAAPPGPLPRYSPAAVAAVAARGRRRREPPEAARG